MAEVQTRERPIDGERAAVQTVHKNPTDARQGEKTGRVRYILAVSITLAIIALAAVYLFSTLSHG